MTSLKTEIKILEKVTRCLKDSRRHATTNNRRHIQALQIHVIQERVNLRTKARYIRGTLANPGQGVKHKLL